MFRVELQQLFQKLYCHACFPSRFKSITNVEHHPEPPFVEVDHQPQQRYKMVGFGFGGVVGFTILVGAARLLQKNSRRDPPPLDPDIGSNSLGLPPIDPDMRSNSIGLPPATNVKFQLPSFPPPPPLIPKSVRFQLPSLPPTTIPANPNLVKLSIYTNERKRRVDIGVIVSSDGQFVTVLSRAYFIYKNTLSEAGPRKFHEGKVTVILQGEKFYSDGPTFQAHVVHVDCSRHAAILKFACSMQFPTVEFCSSKNLSVGQQLVSFDIGCALQYIHEIHTVRGVPNGGVCGDYFHANVALMMGPPGVFVLDGKLMGLRMTLCPQDESLVHGLAFDCCTENLKLSENLSVDVRPSLAKGDVNIGVRVPLRENDKEAHIGFILHEMKAEMGIMRMCMEEIISALRQLPSINLRKRRSPVAKKYKGGPSKAKGNVVLDVEDDIVRKEDRGNEAEEEGEKTEESRESGEGGRAIQS